MRRRRRFNGKPPRRASEAAVGVRMPADGAAFCVVGGSAERYALGGIPL